MDENPYKSPEKESLVGKQRSKAAASEPAKNRSERYLPIIVPLETWLGLAVSQAIAFEIVDSVFNFEKTVFAGVPLWLGLSIFSFLAIPFAVAMVYWYWRKPRSRWPVVVANLIGVSPFILALIGLWVFGLE